MEPHKDSITTASRAIKVSPGMMLLGLSQAFFEGGMYTFVFMWVPALISLNGGMIPTGLLFSCLMLSLTLGGTLASTVLNLRGVFGMEAQGVSILMQVLAVGSMAVPVVEWSWWPVFISFLVFESTVGMFNCCGGMLRSKYYPDKIQSSLMSVFRVPLNALVCLGTKLAGWAGSDPESLQMVFAVVVGMQVIALVLQLVIKFKYPPPPTPAALNKIVDKILKSEDGKMKKASEGKAGSSPMKSSTGDTTMKQRKKSPGKSSPKKGRAQSGSRSPAKKQK